MFPNTYSEIKQIEQKSYTVPEAELNEIRTNVYNYFAVNEDILQSKAFGDAWSAFYESVVEPFAIQFSETMSQACFSDKESDGFNDYGDIQPTPIHDNKRKTGCLCSDG